MNSNQNALNMKVLSQVVVVALAISVLGCSNANKNTRVNAETSTANHVNTYETSFPLTENPMSEGGHWIEGKAVGIDWGDIFTTPGYAAGKAGPKHFADSTAILKGTWGPTQTAEAVVSSKTPANWPEVSLRLRSSLSPHRCTGYEISDSLRKGDSAYLIIVRWNGPLADFTYLAQLGGKKYSVTTGDVMKATIVGNVITAYKNGVKLAQVTDNTYSTGNPGMGFNEGVNGDYGISHFMATDVPITGAAHRDQSE